MPNNAGVNRVFLLGVVTEEPVWQVINGERVLCFLLSTTEEIKKDSKPMEHIELHRVKIPLEMTKNGFHLQKDDQLYIQGKINTRVVFENQVKLYRTEILATSVEHLKTADKHMYAL